MTSIINEFEVFDSCFQNIKENIELFQTLISNDVFEVLTKIDSYLLKSASHIFVSKISYLFNSYVFLVNENVVYCYGDNTVGQLGLGHNKRIQNCEQIKEFEKGESISEFFQGNNCMFAKTQKNEIYYWGVNQKHRIGFCEPTGDEYIRPTKINELIDINNLCCGNHHNLALTNRGEIFAWGLNNFGQLGTTYELKRNSEDPVKILFEQEPDGNISFISVYQNTSFALTKEGHAYFWGENCWKNRESTEYEYFNEPRKLKLNSVLKIFGADQFVFYFNGTEVHKIFNSEDEKIEIEGKICDLTLDSEKFLICRLMRNNCYHVMRIEYEKEILENYSSLHDYFLNEYYITYKLLKMSEFIRYFVKKYQETTDKLKEKSLHIEQLGNFISLKKSPERRMDEPENSELIEAKIGKFSGKLTKKLENFAIEKRDSEIEVSVMEQVEEGCYFKKKKAKNVIQIIKCHLNCENKYEFELDYNKLTNWVQNVKDMEVVIISVVGPTQTGKSFLLNLIGHHLTNRTNERSIEGLNQPSLIFIHDFLSGFESRADIDPVTNGFWLSEPFIVKKNDGKELAILLMDTQSVFDEINDWNRIFWITLLMSSHIIINLMTNLSDGYFQKLEPFINYINENFNKTNSPCSQSLIFMLRDWNKAKQFEYGQIGGHKYLSNRFHKEGSKAKKIEILLKKCFKNLECYLCPGFGLSDEDQEFYPSVDNLSPAFNKCLNELMVQSLNENDLITKRVGSSFMKGSDLCSIFKVYVKLFNEDILHHLAIKKATIIAFGISSELNIDELDNKFSKIWNLVKAAEAEIQDELETKNALIADTTRISTENVIVEYSKNRNDKSEKKYRPKITDLIMGSDYSAGNSENKNSSLVRDEAEESSYYSRKKIFISYVRIEADSDARKLKSELRSLGFDVFLDVDEISGGEDWNDAINYAVLNCWVFIPLITQKYGYTKWTNHQIRLADMMNKLIIAINFLDFWPPECLAIQCATMQYIPWKNQTALKNELADAQDEQSKDIKLWEDLNVKIVANNIRERLISIESPERLKLGSNCDV